MSEVTADDAKRVYSGHITFSSPGPSLPGDDVIREQHRQMMRDVERSILYGSSPDDHDQERP